MAQTHIKSPLSLIPYLVVWSLKAWELDDEPSQIKRERFENGNCDKVRQTEG